MQKTRRYSEPRIRHKGKQMFNMEQYSWHPRGNWHPRGIKCCLGKVQMAWDMGRSSAQPARVQESWEAIEGK